jgi:hypothetical protein
MPSQSGMAMALVCATLFGSLERSRDLLVWLTKSSDFLPASGVLDYTDDFHDLNQTPAAAFYRLRWSP